MITREIIGFCELKTDKLFAYFYWDVLSDVACVTDSLLLGDALEDGFRHRRPDLSNLQKNIDLEKPLLAQ